MRNPPHGLLTMNAYPRISSGKRWQEIALAHGLEYAQVVHTSWLGSTKDGLGNFYNTHQHGFFSDLVGLARVG